jgi:isoleucyl-tRNA synthetase
MKAAHTTLFYLLTTLVKLMAPILPFTSEELWRYLPPEGEREESVHLSHFPQLDQTYSNTQLSERWQRLFQVRDVVLKVLEEKRAEKLIGNSLEAEVNFKAPDKLFLFLKSYHNILEDLFIVSKVTISKLTSGKELTLEATLEALEVTVLRVPGKKCERCWKYSETVGEDQDHPNICHRCAQVVKGSI